MSIIPEIFICHDSRDKQPFVSSLAAKLEEQHITVWYDQYSLTVGDSLIEKIEDGLRSSRYGIIIVSNNFIRNNKWPRKEYEILRIKELQSGKKVILPIWLDVSEKEVSEYSLDLVGKLALRASDGLDSIIIGLLKVLRPTNIPKINSQNTPLSTKDKKEPTIKDEFNYYFYNRDFKVAMETCDSFLKDNPNDVWAITKKGMCLYHLKEFNAAISCFDKALKIDGEYVIADEARRQARKELVMHLEAESLLDRADNVRELNNDAEAMRLCTKALEIEPDNVKALILMGTLFDHLKNREKELLYYDKALKIDPKNVVATSKKAMTLTQMKQFDKAKSILEDALREFPDEVRFLVPMAELLSQQGEVDKALACLDKALLIEPKNLWALKWKNIISQIRDVERELSRLRTELDKDRVGSIRCF